MQKEIDFLKTRNKHNKNSSEGFKTNIKIPKHRFLKLSILPHYLKYLELKLK